ncbi:MAG: GNAT family N-acetyltransferase [Phycisphaerae bacterium]
MPPFPLQPTLTSPLLTLRPLVLSDYPALFAVASDPKIWEQHPVPTRYQEPLFKQFFESTLASKGALVVIDNQTQKIIGSSRYSQRNPAISEIEIGGTFLARSHWGGSYNRELKRLMLTHAFQFVDTVLFEIGIHNLRSQKALQKIGATLTPRRELRLLHGTVVEHLVYQIKNPSPLRAV